MSKNYKPINILFRNDDPCALSNPAHERRFLEIFAKYGIPQVVSVIPFMSEDPHNCQNTKFHELSENQDMVNLLKEYSEKGLIEIAQHGTTHQTNHIYCSSPLAALYPPYLGLGFPWLNFRPMNPEQGYSEFNELDQDVVQKELRRGKVYLDKIFQQNINTFTFPWGTSDLSSVHALKKEGFKTALCGGGRNIHLVRDFLTIYNPREDVFEFTKEFNDLQLKSPVLYHIVFHSWMLKEDDFPRLEQLLSGLAANDRVGFVTVKDLQQWPVSFRAILEIDHRVRYWGLAARHHLGSPAQLPRRYDLNLKSYWKGFVKNGLVALVFGKIGFNRFLVYSALLFLICIVFMNITPGLGVVDSTALICLGIIFLVSLVCKFKNQAALAIREVNKKYSQNYEKVSAKVFSDPQNRELVEVFFRLFEQHPNSFTEDRKKYLQLKYFHSERPWEALNELAGHYAPRGLTTLALMCHAESLRLYPKQKDVFQSIQKLRNLISIKKMNLNEDRYAISVIVCTNRLPRELKTCIRSILANTFQDFEIIVFNNNGPQEIQQAVESFADPRIVYKRIVEDVGIPKGRNMAVQLARGKYIAYLDDDDVFYPDHLAALYNAAENGKYRFVYAKTKGVAGVLEGDEFKEKRIVFNWGSDFDRERFALKASMGNHAVLHERSLFADIGLFNEELIVAEEEDFYLRCAADLELKHVSKNTTEYRIKDNNSTFVNAIRNHFHGAIVRQFHAAFRGELARLKHLVNQHDKPEAQAVLNNIRASYLHGWFKSSFVLDELLPLIQYCGDKDFLKIVISDSNRLYKSAGRHQLVNI